MGTKSRFRTPSPPTRYDIFTPPIGSPEGISSANAKHMPYTPELHDLDLNDTIQITCPPYPINEPTTRIKGVIRSIFKKKVTTKPPTNHFHINTKYNSSPTIAIKLYT